MESQSIEVPLLPLGNRTIPAIGLGTWKSSPGEVYKAVRNAIHLGYRHIDCAYIYGNEVEIGDALHDAIASGEVTRPELFITSKLWNSFHHPDHVEAGLMESLNALRLDYLDLYLMHWPIACKPGVGLPGSVDEFVSLEEQPLIDTWQAMETCVDRGMIRQIGVSNFSIKKLKALLSAARIKPVSNQVEMHPYLQQPELVTFCQDNNVRLTAYASLGSTDRPQGLKRETDPDLLNHPDVMAIANKHQASAAQVLLAWSLHRQVVVIPKSVHEERLLQNIESANLMLDDDDIACITAMDKHYRYLAGDFWAVEGGPYTTDNIWDE